MATVQRGRPEGQFQAGLRLLLGGGADLAAGQAAGGTPLLGSTQGRVASVNLNASVQVLGRRA
jgi:hypothetical protein